MLCKNSCVAIFLDVDKAFDTVQHDGILIKLERLGIKGNLIRFIENFLSHRSIKVRVNNKLSSSYLLQKGVPQGSVISPTLFSVIMNGIFDGLPDGVQTSIYADDGALWTIHSNLPEAMKTMQKSLNIIEIWSRKWEMEISTAKTKVMIFTHKRKLAYEPLKLHGAHWR